MSLMSQILSKLETIISNQGGTVPTIARPANEEDRLVQLLTSVANLPPPYVCATFRARVAADCVVYPFFVADRAYRIIEVNYRHATAESTAAELYCYVLTGTDVFQSDSFNCKSSSALTQSVSPGSGLIAAPTIAAGDYLHMQFSASPTELAGVCVTVTLQPV